MYFSEVLIADFPNKEIITFLKNGAPEKAHAEPILTYVTMMLLCLMIILPHYMLILLILHDDMIIFDITCCFFVY